MTPTDIVYGLVLGAFITVIFHGASKWALEKHHARVTAQYIRQEAKARTQIWERAAQADTKEIQLTIKKDTNA